jgi:protein SCO1/2
MKLSSMKPWVATATILSLASLASTSAYASSPAQPPSSVGVATLTAIPANVATARFVNQRGAPETLGALKGKTVFIVPLLTLCGDTCPFTSGNLAELQGLLTSAKATNVEVVAIDVDPYRDTVKRIAAYAAMFSAPFQIWTSKGTSAPVFTKAELKSKNPVGTGDTNPSLLAVEKFFGWSVQVVPQATPPNTDWMAPYQKLTYDISHSDGFWVVNAKQQVRFISGTEPAFTGTLAKTLATFMHYKSNIYKKAVNKSGWTPKQALQAIEWVTGRNF